MPSQSVLHGAMDVEVTHKDEKIQEAGIVLDDTIGQSLRTCKISPETISLHHGRDWEVFNKRHSGGVN